MSENIKQSSVYCMSCHTSGQESAYEIQQLPFMIKDHNGNETDANLICPICSSQAKIGFYMVAKQFGIGVLYV